MRGRYVGLLSTFILRRPTPTAPDDTRTTRWPSLCSLVTVSTINVKIESMGSWVFSSTIELVPDISSGQYLSHRTTDIDPRTQFDHDCEAG